MDVDKNKDADKNNDENKNKKIFKWEYLLLFVAFVFPIIISFFTSFFNQNLPQFNFYTYVGKCLLVVKQNMGYYGTIFGIFIAIETFLDSKKQREEQKEQRRQDFIGRQEEREKELIRIQEESNLLREKEIENRKDNYRPTFIISNNKIELLMRKEELFLENIKYYPYKTGEYDEEGKYIGTKKSGEYIIEGTKDKPIPDNFYISAETILGEKILFAFLLGEHKVYKCLKDKGNPSLPNGFDMQNYNLEAINQNWSNYNVILNTYNNNKQELLYINIQRLFFYNSMRIRNRIFQNNKELIRRSINSTNHQKLYKSIFFELLALNCYFYKLNYNIIVEVITEVYNQVYDKSDSFKIVNNTISLYKSDVERIIENFCIEFQDKQMLAIISKIKDFFEQFYELGIEKNSSLKHILDCIIEVINIYKKMPDNSNKKNQIIDFCIKILYLIFQNVEIEKDKSDILNSYFLKDKSDILRLITFDFKYN